MKGNLRLGMAALVVVVFGATGTVGVHAQVAVPPSAKIQPSDRGKVLEALAKGDVAGAENTFVELQTQLQTVPAAPGVGPIADAGSTFYEELKSCGFYPQETRLECVIEIKRNSGYSGLVGAFGSMEHVYFCVDWNNTGIFTQFESAGQGSVQMHDGPGSPSWFYAVYRDFNLFGGPRTSNTGLSTTTVTTAPSFRVKAILSWFFAPTGCNFVPVWGNILVFQIRTDPIR
jgi:hypothetical protein